MENLHGEWALVTGASSGLGVEFAKLFAERNANLVLVARRAEPMEQLAEALRKEKSVQVLVIALQDPRLRVLLIPYLKLVSNMVSLGHYGYGAEDHRGGTTKASRGGAKSEWFRHHSDRAYRAPVSRGIANVRSSAPTPGQGSFHTHVG